MLFCFESIYSMFTYVLALALGLLMKIQDVICPNTNVYYTNTYTYTYTYTYIYTYTYTYTYTLICLFLYVSIYSGGLGLLLALGLLLCKPQPLHDNHSHQVPCNMKGVLKPPQDTFYILAKNIKTNGDASKSLVHFLNCFSVAACVFVIDLCSSTVVALVLRFLKIKTYCTQILLWIYIYIYVYMY